MQRVAVVTMRAGARVSAAAELAGQTTTRDVEVGVRKSAQDLRRPGVQPLAGGKSSYGASEEGTRTSMWKDGAHGGCEW